MGRSPDSLPRLLPPVASSRTINHNTAGGAADFVPSAGPDFPIIVETAPVEQQFSIAVAMRRA